MNLSLNLQTSASQNVLDIVGMKRMEIWTVQFYDQFKGKAEQKIETIG